MERRFLDFLELAPRSSKPRNRGITMVNDGGEPITWLREMLDAHGEYIDRLKFSPSVLPSPWRVIEERVKLYRDFNIEVKLDDPIFAIAYYQGKAKQLLETVRDLGFTHVQIDTQHIKLGQEEDTKKAHEDELHYTALARELGLRVEGEVGKKWREGDTARATGGLLNVEWITSEMKRLLAAGCEYVYLESRVIREVLGPYAENERGGQELHQIAEAVGQDKIIFEVTNQLPFDTKQCHRFWLVRAFGPDVNIGNGRIDEIHFIEAIRRGTPFINGPSRSTSKLWIKSLAKNRGKAAEEWWKEDYPIDLSLLAQYR